MSARPTAARAANAPAAPGPPTNRLHAVLAAGCSDTRKVTTGAAFDVFQPVPDSKFQTAVYVFAIHPTTGVVHFAFGRKVPPHTRVPYAWQKQNRGANTANAPSSVLQGAAGTDAKYHGKWASLGGGADKAANSPLQAAIIELNDEAAILPAFKPREHVYVPWINRGRMSPSTRLILVSADQPDTNRRFYSFVFKMPSWAEFARYFPHVHDRANVRGGQQLVTASHGEIDYTASFTVDDIMAFQIAARKNVPPTNFFTSYTLRTLQVLAAPAAEADVRRFGGPGARVPNIAALQSLRVVPDVGPREASGWRNPQGLRYN
jgi:hypothetical protein